jgi:hypothetical protein
LEANNCIIIIVVAVVVGRELKSSGGKQGRELQYQLQKD